MSVFQIIKEAMRFDVNKVAHVASWGSDQVGIGRGSILRPFRTPQSALTQLNRKPTTSAEFLKEKTLKFMDGGTHVGDLTVYTSKMTFEGSDVFIKGRIVLDHNVTERYGNAATHSCFNVKGSGKTGFGPAATSGFGFKIGDTTEALYVVHNSLECAAPAISLEDTLIAGRVHHDDMTAAGTIVLENCVVPASGGTTMLDMTAYVLSACTSTLGGKSKVKAAQFPFSNVILQERFQVFNAPGATLRGDAAFKNCVFADYNARDKTFQGPVSSAIFDAFTNWTFKQNSWATDSTTCIILSDTTAWF